MTTIKPTPEQKYATIRNSVKVDEDILNQVAKTKGVSKAALKMRFPKPDQRQDYETNLEHYARMYDKTFKMVKRVIKKQFPESPEDAKFDVQERIQFLNSIGVPTEIQVMDRKEPYQKGALNFIENRITKFDFHTYLFDRASRTAMVSYDVGSKKSDEPEKHVVILLDEDIKSKNYVSLPLAKPNGMVRYFFTDFYHVAATRLLRQMIVDFVNSRHDLAKYGVLNYFSNHSGLCKLTITSDSLRDRVVAYAESIGHKVLDMQKDGKAKFPEFDLSLVMQAKHFLEVSKTDYLPVNHTALTYIVLIKEFLRFMNALQDKIENLSINRAAAAKPYESKKNQTMEHIERASNSRLLEYFSKIEIDGEVGIDEFDYVEKAFRKMFKKTPLPKVPGSSFRLRKLGREKAAGMYYVEPKAVVVDFRGGLKSCVHELMHHFDYTYDQTRQEGTEALHEGFAFRDLYDRYVAFADFQAREIAKKEAIGNVNDDELKFHTVWNGNSKYNKAYYLQEEEVFARLGEVVMAFTFGGRELKKNILFKSVEDLETGTLHQVIYPLEEQLIEDAIEYYQRTLPFLFLEQKG